MATLGYATVGSNRLRSENLLRCAPRLSEYYADAGASLWRSDLRPRW
jgi:hypothetical protein